LGRFLGGFIALLGIGMIALPAGILGSGFVEEMENQKDPAKGRIIYPNCGHHMDRRHSRR